MSNDLFKLFKECTYKLLKLLTIIISIKFEIFCDHKFFLWLRVAHKLLPTKHYYILWNFVTHQTPFISLLFVIFFLSANVVKYTEKYEDMDSLWGRN